VIILENNLAVPQNIKHRVTLLEFLKALLLLEISFQGYENTCPRKNLNTNVCQPKRQVGVYLGQSEQDQLGNTFTCPE
jgi:hypothetical protein